MDKQFDLRKFLKVSGMSPGVGALISFSPAMAGGGPAATARKAFECAIDVINGLNPQQELILFTGDLTHETAVRRVGSNLSPVLRLLVPCGDRFGRRHRLDSRSRKSHSSSRNRFVIVFRRNNHV